MSSPRTFLVWLIPGVVLSIVVAYFGDTFVISGLREISVYYLTSLVTFDGIMVAAVIFSSNSFKPRYRWMGLVFVSPFLISAFATLRSLLRLHIAAFNVESAFIGRADTIGIELAIGGIVFWLWVIVGLLVFLPESQVQ